VHFIQTPHPFSFSLLNSMASTLFGAPSLCSSSSSMFSTHAKLSLKPNGVSVVHSLERKNPLSLPTTHSPTQRRFKITAMAPPKPGGGKAKKGKNQLHSFFHFEFLCFAVIIF